MGVADCLGMAARISGMIGIIDARMGLSLST